MFFYVFAKSTISSSKLIVFLKTHKKSPPRLPNEASWGSLGTIWGINLVIFGASLAFLAFLLALFACNFGRLSRQDLSREAFFMKFEFPKPLPRSTKPLASPLQASFKPPSPKSPSSKPPVASAGDAKRKQSAARRTRQAC